MDRGRRWLNGFLVFVAAVLVLMWTAEVYTDFLWYRHDAYLVVFWRKILAQVLIVALVAPALWWFLRANLRRAAEAVPLSAPDDDEQAEAQATLDSAAASSARWLPVLAALFGGLWATRGWQSWLMVLWGVPFDQADPAFGLDAGFYVYRLNAFQQLLGTLNTLLLATAAVATLIYLLRKVIVMGQGELTFDRGARGHLLALAAGLLLPKFVAGFSGDYVNAFGYAQFFVSTALLGLPVLVLVWLASRAEPSRVMAKLQDPKKA